MTPDDARAALATIGLAPDVVGPIGDGWASWTFELDGTRIAQFPRDESAARGHRRARRVLPELAEHASFRVPQPDTVGEWRGLPFHVYEKLPGAGLTEDRLDDVAVGDPAIDFVGIFNAFGLTAARTVIEHYGPIDPDFSGRMRFYRWMGSVHAARYALDIDDADLLADAIEQIEVRIADRPRASAAVLRGDEILLVRNLNRYWTLPGGGVEPGEGFEEAVLRELREEAGMGGVIARELYRRTFGQGSEVCFLVESYEDPVVTDDPDVTAVGWFPLDQVSRDPQVLRVRAALRAP